MILVEDPETCSPSSVAIRTEYLCAFQSVCCELCVGNI